MDDYVIRRATADDIKKIIELVTYVYLHMRNKNLFAWEGEDEEWMKQNFEKGSFAVVTVTSIGEIVGMEYLYAAGESQYNLGRDIGLPIEELKKVANVELAVVHPNHRGHGLERRMVEFIKRQPEMEQYAYLMATVDPDNAPSLKSALNAGFKIMTTKKKYGGLTRHIMLYDNRK